MKNIDWVFLDLETTGFDPQADKIIEIAAVIRYADGRREEYQQLVNPGISIPLQITRLTGINDAMLAEAPFFTDIKEHLERIIAGKVIVAHNAGFDVGFLETAFGCQLPNRIIDTIELARIVSYNQASYSLRYLSRSLALGEQPNHRAMADTLALEKLFFILLDIAREIPLAVLQEIAHFLGSGGKGLNLLLSEIIGEKIRKYDFTGGPIYPQEEPEYPYLPNKEVSWSLTALERAFLPGGEIAQGLGSYQKRTQQISMMKAIAKAFQQERHLIVEAGTGVGKTLAYLMPALTWALSQKEKVVVATHTIALQEQILQSDIKFLRQNLEFPFKAEVLKGRSNYLCLYKWKTAKDNAANLTWFEKVAMARMAHWLAKSKTGDKDSINLRDWENEFFFQFASNRENCGGAECPFARDCFYQKARQKAQNADLIIVNHSLLLSDLKIGDTILPKYRYLIIDEAHHLEEEGTRQFSADFSLREFQRIIQQITRKRDILNKNGVLPYWKQQLPAYTGKDQAQVEEALRIVQDSSGRTAIIQSTVENIFQFCRTQNVETLRVHKDVRKERWWDNLSILFANLALETGALYDRLKKLYMALTQDLELSEGENSLRQLKAVLIRLEQDFGFLQNFFTSDPDREQVYWLENDPYRPDLKLYITPLKTGRLFAEMLFSTKTSAILTSATMSVNNSFSYIKEQLGLSEELVDVLQIQSPFLYEEQVLLLVDTSLPEPSLLKEEEYNLAVGRSLWELIGATGGGTLVLFTSRKQLRQLYESLCQPLQELGLELFADGINGNRINLVNELKENPKAVVFGTNTFWEGIDLPGESLTAVVIVRLPFAPPNLPLAEARMEELKKEGKDGFLHYSLPQAVLRFRQGYGRLIRTIDDCGVVIVLDNRVVTKRYGKIFIKSLPSHKYLAGDTNFVAGRVRQWFREFEIKVGRDSSLTGK